MTKNAKDRRKQRRNQAHKQAWFRVRLSRDATQLDKVGVWSQADRVARLGVSDGFGSDLPHSKMQLHLYAMLNEWFVDRLRAKVQRGMDDAFDQGKVIQPPAYGYRLEPVRDDDGQIVTQRRQIKSFCGLVLFSEVVLTMR